MAVSPDAITTGSRVTVRWADERVGGILDIACFDLACFDLACHDLVAAPMTEVVR